MKLLLATNNRHKAEEIRSVLSDINDLEITTPAELGLNLPEPVEDGETLEANAWIKAKEIHEATGLPVIADDTGLEVDELNGAPGVYSARYAGEGATYQDNCRKLLKELGDEENRRGKFRTVICYTDGGRTFFAEGEVKGTITREERGGDGFGYDPIFQPEGESRTFAEMSADEKNSISHRGRAVRNFRDALTALREAGSEIE